MKISVDIDCTPEEARRFMGLPDMAPVHAVYTDRITELMREGASSEMMEQIVRAWTPMGDAGLNVWKQLVGQIAGVADKG